MTTTILNQIFVLCTAYLTTDPTFRACNTTFSTMYQFSQIRQYIDQTDEYFQKKGFEFAKSIAGTDYVVTAITIGDHLKRQDYRIPVSNNLRLGYNAGQYVFEFHWEF